MEFPNQESLDFLAALGKTPDYGLPKWMIFAHFCHESFYFKRRAGLHNFMFLVKPSGWDGLVAVSVDKDGGKSKEFVDFVTIDEMIFYYLNYVKTIFPGVMKCKNCSTCFAWALENWNDTGIYPRQLIELLKFLQGEEEVTLAFDRLVP